jgi:orotate phosphoribosyltransferase
MRIEVVAGEEVAAVIVSAVIARAASQRQPPLRFRLPICNHRLQPRSPRR